MNNADDEMLWKNVKQLVSHMELLKEHIKQLEKKYRRVSNMSLTEQVLATENKNERITCDNPQNIIFKAETLIPVIQEAIKDNCNVCLVKNYGIFMISEESDNNMDEYNLSYANGFDPERYEPDERYKLQDALDGTGGPAVCVGRIPVDNMALRHVLEHRTDLEVTLIPMQFDLRAVEK